MILNQPVSLLISLIIEVPLALFLTKFILEIPYKNLLGLLFVASSATLITHPLAWNSNQILAQYLQFPPRAVLIESIVIILEAILYKLFRQFNWYFCFFLSAIANLTSFLAGLVV